MFIPVINLYGTDNAGKLRVWSIEVVDWDIVIRHGVVGGTLQEKIEEVDEGKGGRTLEEQIESRVQSRIKSKMDSGYVEIMEQAKNKKKTNALELPKPMLAQTFKDFPLEETYLQLKYDGSRCLITKRDGKIVAYSRNGKVINTIGHIIKAAESIPEGMILDGELYCHGVPLQTLMSWTKRKQPDTEKLEYICYDTVSDKPFKERLEIIKSLDLKMPIKIAHTVKYSVTGIKDTLYKTLDDAVKAGYEGLIVRQLDTGYEDGKRSKSLLKVKSWLDEEYEVKNITISRDGLPILFMMSKGCKFHAPKSFKATAPGNADQKAEVLLDVSKYIGKKVTLKFAYYTKDGVPFHPVAVAWRDGD